MMSLANDVLSNSLILTALLCGVIFGFAFTILILHANDCRVFDAQGKYIPGPLTNLWGKNLTNVLSCARKAKKISLATCEELLNELGNGDIVAFNSMLGKQTVVVGHPELIKSVLSGHHLKFLKTAHMNRLKFFLGEGLFTSEGSRWQSHRQLIGAGFQSENLKSMIPNFNLQTQRILKYWNSNISKLRKVDPSAHSIPVNLKNDFHHLTMSIMCFSAFSYDFQHSHNRDTISAAFEAISSELNERNNDPTDWWHMLYPARTGSTKTALEVFHTLLDDIINTRLVDYTKNLNKRLKRRSARKLQNLSSNSISTSNSNDEELHGLKVIVNENTMDDNNTYNTHSMHHNLNNVSRMESLMHNPSETHALHNTNTTTNSSHHHSNNNTTTNNPNTSNTSTSSTAPPIFQRGSSATHTSTNGDKTILHTDVSPTTHPNPHTTHNVHSFHSPTHTNTHTTHNADHTHTLHGNSSNSVTSPYNTKNAVNVEGGSANEKGVAYDTNDTNSSSGGVGVAGHRQSSRPTSPVTTNTTHSTHTTTNTTHSNTNTKLPTTNTKHPTTTTPSTTRTRDLLDLLIHCGEANTTAPSNKLSRTEIRDHLYTFLTTGHETTSACLQWTVYELCRHPEVQRKCQAEIDAVLRGSDSSGSSTTSTHGTNTTTNSTNSTTTNKHTLTFEHKLLEQDRCQTKPCTYQYNGEANGTPTYYTKKL